MSRILQKHFLACILINFVFFSAGLEAKPIIISVAKSGTHLLSKAIFSLSGQQRVYVPNKGAIPREKNKLIGTHFQHQNVVKLISKDMMNETIIVNVRDPRDVLVSAAFFYPHVHIYDAVTKKQIKINLQPLDIRQRIKFFLKHPETNPSPVQDIKLAVQFIEEHKNTIHVFKYEDLVGAKGKGDLDTQFGNLKRLNEILNSKKSDLELRQIQSVLFGNTQTFRKGVKGEWKIYFNEKIKKEFAEVLGEELILLGYSQDTD